MTGRVWTEQEIRALGSTTDLPTAGAVLGIGSNNAYALAKADRFPVPVLELGAKKRVLVSDLLRYCGWLPPLPAAQNQPAGLRAV
jgi:hypothetical protein